jgi:hypothetical protein
MLREKTNADLTRDVTTLFAFKASVDLSSNYSLSVDYIDASIVAMETTILDIVNVSTNDAIAQRDVSIAWLAAQTAGEVTKAYVDASIAVFATNASVGLVIAPFATNASVGLSIAPFATNASVGLNITTIDASLQLLINADKTFATNASVGTALGAYATNASIGLAGFIKTPGLTIVDTSMYWTAPDTSIWSWKITKV